MNDWHEGPIDDWPKDKMTITDKVSHMVLEGYRRHEIAEALGISEISVSNARRYANSKGRNLPYFRRRYPPTLTVEMSNQNCREKLVEEAAARGISTARLAGRILTKVLKDDLIEAVLDDDGGCGAGAAQKP